MAPLIETAARAETKRIRNFIAFPLLAAGAAADGAQMVHRSKLCKCEEVSACCKKCNAYPAGTMHRLHREAHEKAPRIAPERLFPF